MALDRKVLIPDGTTRDTHEITRIIQEVGYGTRVEVDSKGAGVETYTWDISFPFDDGMTVALAYDAIAASPQFAEYVDPNAEAIATLLPTITDEQAELVPAIFPAWAAGVAYAIGDRVRYGALLWRCVQAHTSQGGWEPDAAASLWVRTTPEGVIPEWVQPTGGHDAYASGDKVTHNGKTWESLVDANVWEPGAAGTEALWREV